MSRSRKVIIGLDTSFYTTSVALVDLERGTLLRDERQYLKVGQGKRGLQPSEAVFQHVLNIPLLIEQALGYGTSFTISGNRLAGEGHVADWEREDGGELEAVAVAASIRPRPSPDSYLPVFKVSEAVGRSLAAAWGVPFLPTSHQEGHLKAALWSAGVPERREFLAVHISGGTTELLRVTGQPGTKSMNAFSIERLGGSLDLHAGQFIDRAGVAMGLPFPSGAGLEEMAREGIPGKEFIPSAVRGYDISFAGPYSHFLRLLAAGSLPADLAWAVQQCVANSLEKVLRPAIEETGLADVVFIGGVAANLYLRQRLKKRLEHRAVGARLYFAEPRFCVDNAVGVALVGRSILLR